MLATAAGARPDGEAGAGARRPNIIFILADDLGYADLSCYGAQGYETPVLDALAANGARFTQAYANSCMCSPTRVAIATGRYQYHFRAGLNEPNIGFQPGDELPPGTPTIASMLKAAGYRTALVGKWHVAKVPEFGPLQYGYDHFFGIPGGGADYFLHSISRDVGKPGAGLHDGDTPVTREGYLTDILTDEAIRVVETKGARPLFLSLHYTAPHWPWEGPEDGERAKTLTDMRDLGGGSLETYAKMVRNLDWNIGRLVAALRDTGLADDTLIVFTSDNGGERYSNSWPLTGTKGELLEGGIRVPMIAHWPRRIAPGTPADQVAISMDSVPTFLAAAGAVPPAGLDGIDLLPQLTGAAPAVPRTLYWRHRAHDQAAVREGDWKYLRLGGKEHLFNVRTDPRERAQQKDVHPDIFAALKAKWTVWNEGMLPYPDQSFSESTAGTYADRYPALPPESWARPHPSTLRRP